MTDDTCAIEPGKGVGVIQLGVPREEVLRRLAEAGFQAEEDEEGSCWYYVDEMDTELKFTEGDSPVLEEIAISDDRARLGPLGLIDEPISKIIELLRVADEDTQWTLRKDRWSTPPSEDSSAQNPADNQPSQVPIESLLSEGTLWIVSFGLGLDLVYGDVLTVHLRNPGDIHLPGYGSLTYEQREFVAQPDLKSQLIGTGPRSDNQAWQRTGSRFQLFAGLALLAGIGLVIWQGIDYQRRWNVSPVAQAEVIAVSPPPPDPFPNYFTIAYEDQHGQRHQAVLHHSEIFSLSKIGDKIEIHYLPEAPDQPMGPWGAKSAAFDKYIPWGIGVFAVYIGLQFGAGIYSLIPRKK